MKHFIIIYVWVSIAVFAVCLLVKFLRWLPPLTRMLTIVLTAILGALYFSLSIWAVIVLASISFLFLLCLYFEEKKPIAGVYEHQEESEMSVSAFTEFENDWWERISG